MSSPGLLPSAKTLLWLPPGRVYRRLVEVSFVRSKSHACEIIVKRDDGVVLRSVQPLRDSRTPHDLVHFAVEGALELGEGLWGCVAEGAEFKSFEHVSGRRRPHARERSRDIVRRARRQITTAEVLAGAIERLAHSGWDGDQPRLYREVERQLSNCEPPRPPISGERVARACVVLRDHERRWAELPVGQSLDVRWPPTRAGVDDRV